MRLSIWESVKFQRIWAAVHTTLSGAESFGKRPLMAGKVVLNLKGKANFGDDFMADGTRSAIAISVRPGAALTVGRGVYMNGGVWIDVLHEIHIGDNVLFGPFASVIDDHSHQVHPEAQLFERPVIVGNNVWLGRNVAVMPGVHIGNGSVIAAHSVVTRDIPENCFAAGAPARVVKKIDLPQGWIRY